MVLEKTLGIPLDYKEIQPVHSKGDKSWVFQGLMLKLKLQYFGYLMRSDFLKRPWCWERLRRKEKGMTEDDMVLWYHQFNGHEFM